MRTFLLVSLSLAAVFCFIAFYKSRKAYKRDRQSGLVTPLREILFDSWSTFMWPVRTLWDLGSSVRGKLRRFVYNHFRLPRMEGNARLEWHDNNTLVRVGYSRILIAKFEHIFDKVTICNLPQTDVWYVEYKGKVVRGLDGEIFLSRQTAYTDAEAVLSGLREHLIHPSVLDAGSIYGMYWQASRDSARNDRDEHVPMMLFKLFHPNARSPIGHLSFEPRIGEVKICGRYLSTDGSPDGSLLMPIDGLLANIGHVVKAEEDHAIHINAKTLNGVERPS